MGTGDATGTRRPATLDRRPSFYWVTLSLVAALGAAYVLVAFVLAMHGRTFADPGWTPVSEHGRVLVGPIVPGGTADGLLETGAVVVAIDGRSELNRAGVEAYLLGLPAGSSYRLAVEGSAGRREHALAVGTRTSAFDAAEAAVQIVTGMAFLVVGALLGLGRPDYRTAQFGAWAFLAMALYSAGLALEPLKASLGPAGLALLVTASVVQNRLPAVIGFHYFSTPAPGESWKGTPGWVLGLLYGFSVVLTVPAVLIGWQTVRGGAGQLAFFAAAGRWVGAYRIVSDSFGVGMLIAMLLAIFVTFRVEISPELRRRLRWMFSGIVVGCVPVVVVRLAELVMIATGPKSVVAVTDHSAIRLASVLAFGLVPASIGYAILKNRLLDIAIVVRQSVKYALARGVISVVVTLPVALFLIRAWQDRHLTLNELLFRNSGFLVLASGAVLALRFRKRLIGLIDRRFFRAAYNTEQILLALIDTIRSAESIRDVSTLASARIEDALHPRSVFVVFRDRERPNLEMTYARGRNSDEFGLPSEATVVRLLEGERAARSLDTLRDKLPESELQLLVEHDVELIVPMAGTDGRCVGAILLGQKASEEPYSAPDRRLLESVAAQMAVVFENAQLRDRVARDQRERAEVLGRVDDRGINLVRECPVCGRCYDSADATCSEDGVELTLPLPVERTIEGRYRLDALVGRGGMGAVYRSTDTRLNRVVAVKVLSAALFGDHLALRRFEREAQASARLAHPNIVAVYDYGVLGTGGAFLVMELVDGESMRVELRRSGLLPRARVAFLMRGVCAAVRAAHAAGVIHRDLKPENVLLTRVAGAGDQVVKVLDFGIAKIVRHPSPETESLTAPGSVLGTIGYMSPEQLEGRAVDARSDVFSLGVMAIEALTGSRPFSGESLVQLARSMSAGVVDLQLEGPDSDLLREVLARAVAHDPTERHGSVDAFDAALDAALAGGGGLAPDGSQPASAPGELPTVVQPAGGVAKPAGRAPSDAPAQPAASLPTVVVPDAGAPGLEASSAGGDTVPGPATEGAGGMHGRGGVAEPEANATGTETGFGADDRVD